MFFFRILKTHEILWNIQLLWFACCSRDNNVDQYSFPNNVFFYPWYTVARMFANKETGDIILGFWVGIRAKKNVMSPWVTDTRVMKAYIFFMLPTLTSSHFPRWLQSKFNLNTPTWKNWWPLICSSSSRDLSPALLKHPEEELGEQWLCGPPRETGS